MAGIVLEFSHHGDFDSFGIIRSSTPTNLTNLPSPLVIGLTTMFYVDTAVVEDQTYYYRPVVWLNGEMMVGDEVMVVAKPKVPNYRYMRVFITENNGLDSHTEFQQIEFSLAAGGADITTSATPSNQSSYYSGRPAANLVSNDFGVANYIWTTAVGVAPPHWVSFDLLTPQDVVEVRMFPTNLHPWQGRAPKNFIIQGSNDNSTWVNIRSFSNVTGWVPGTGKVFSLK